MTCRKLFPQKMKQCRLGMHTNTANTPNQTNPKPQPQIKVKIVIKTNYGHEQQTGGPKEVPTATY